MKSTVHSIQEIISGCLKGKPKFQKALVKQHSGFLYAICCRYINDAEFARDALQETLMLIFKNLDKYQESKGAFEPWITTIAISHCLNKLKKKNLTIVPLEMESKVEQSYDGEKEILDRMDLVHIIELISELPLKYRVVFNLAAIDGYSHAEIAELLSISEVNSRVNLNRAKSILRKRLLKLQKNEKWVITR